MGAKISDPSKIQIPVIYPSTLTEEQRNLIMKFYAFYYERLNSDCEDDIAAGHIDALDWLFGEDLFNIE